MESSSGVEWTANRESALLEALREYLPYGPDRAVQLVALAFFLSSKFGVSVTAKDVSDKLERLFQRRESHELRESVGLHFELDCDYADWDDDVEDRAVMGLPPLWLLNNKETRFGSESFFTESSFVFSGEQQLQQQQVTKTLTATEIGTAPVAQAEPAEMIVNVNVPVEVAVAPSSPVAAAVASSASSAPAPASASASLSPSPPGVRSRRGRPVRAWVDEAQAEADEEDDDDEEVVDRVEGRDDDDSAFGRKRKQKKRNNKRTGSAEPAVSMSKKYKKKKLVEPVVLPDGTFSSDDLIDLPRLNDMFMRYLTCYQETMAEPNRRFHGLTEFVFAVLLELGAERRAVPLADIYAHAQQIWSRLPQELAQRFESKDFKGNIRSTLYACQIFIRPGDTAEEKKTWMLRGRPEGLVVAGVDAADAPRK